MTDTAPAADAANLFTPLRTSLVAACPLRSRLLLGLCDAVLTRPGVGSSFPELSLERTLLTHHQLYAGVRAGDIDTRALLHAAAGTSPPLPGPYPRVVAFDATSIPRPYSPTSGERTMVLTNTRAGTRVTTPGWELHHAVLLNADMDSWVTPLLVDVNPETVTPQSKSITGTDAIVLRQLELLGAELPERILGVCDSGYDAMHLTHQVRARNLDADLLVRLRSNSVMYRDVPTPETRTVGRPRRHGERIKAGESQRPDADLHLTHTHPQLGRVLLEAWGSVHPKLKHRGDFQDASPDELLVTGTFIHVQLHTPRVGKGSMWLWWTGVFPSPEELIALWWAYTRRYDIEHHFRLLKKSWGLETYTPRKRSGLLTWARVLLMSYLHLIVARAFVTEIPYPWHRRRRQGCLTPNRVRRAFSGLVADLPRPPAAPKTRRGGRGTPAGTIRTPRTEHRVIVREAA